MHIPLALLFTLFACTCVRAQTHETHALKAYLGGETTEWNAALAATAAISDRETQLLTRAEYQLGRASTAMVASDKADCDLAVKEVAEELDRLWDLNEQNAAAHGLYSGLLGLKIARTPMSGMIHGSRASRYAREGLELDGDNPTALFYAASNLFYTPEEWGGDLPLALSYLQRASLLYGPKRADNYRYLATLALLGQVQAKLNKTAEARATYSLALETQPDFHYVSKVLLPQLSK